MMKRPCDPCTTALGFWLLTVLACGGSPSSTETGSSETSAPQSDACTTATSTMTPTTGATGGATTGTTGDATAGSTSMPTTGEPDGAMFCEERCTVDADCAISGDNSGLSCKDNRCVDDPCLADQDCLFNGVFLLRKCAAQADCEMSVCVDAGDGVGRCAEVADGSQNCQGLGGSEAIYPPIEGGAPVAVCVFPEYVCRDGECDNPCESDDDCFLIIQPTCDVGTGECICKSDADCQAVPGSDRPLCIAGRCGCASDTDCVGGDTDRCYDGRCGCSSEAACTFSALFDGTTVVCE